MPSHTSSTPSPPEDIRRHPTPPVPPSSTTDQDMRSVVQLLTSLVASQAQRQNTDAIDKPVSMRVCDFINLDPPVFTGSDPKEYPHTFIDQVHRTLRVMHASDTEAVELASYRLRDLAVFWYDSCERSRGLNAPPTVWKEFSEAFLHHYLPVEIRRARADKFLNIRQGNMNMREYNMQFDSLARYALHMVAEMSDRAYSKALEDRKRQQRADREQDRGQHKRARFSGYSKDFRGSVKPQSSRSSAPPVDSAPL
ncbi:uncharacterized protein [Nicotiana sylvestris]|uniref:uncharacterized protein n=1 Tax=Nicotiana sylvestris TaxID=4096 RepID=UPI00388CC910